ncbi:hypothetical protein CHLRE_04g218750v5 [Chlamydomonas reinhardtii]|uniref:Uncharacterized protein n=2 Tax=Chlamydomonas reinhardtii TaxID=3055 RepID=A0A2K3DU18_CHLRE|nr:uncharacterized protein CHLRE_04g218750v5 [Chlamydomonas reinhardtii]PNW84040.1 hypothetical protein CHLRE_04g218750v5 [Chlamydomonas reinhardtii]
MAAVNNGAVPGNGANPLYGAELQGDGVKANAAPANVNGSVSSAGQSKSAATTRSTLHAKLGGAAAVAATVDVFYKKLMNDPDLEPFFRGVDMVTLIAKQNRFLAYAFGATTHYHGKDIVMGHAHLIINRGLNLTHFDKVAGHFVDSLKEMGVGQELIDEAAGVLIGVRPLFDPERYKGKVDVEKIEKAATTPQSKPAEAGQDAPACCTIM